MSEEAQKTYVKNSYEYPVHNKVVPDDIVSNWGKFKIDSLDLNSLGKFRGDAINIFEKTGWN